MKKQDFFGHRVCYIIYSMSVIEDKKRRQKIKVILAELAMVVSVAAIVAVALLAAMGFFVNSEGGIEQSGLVQIHSLPTGASVTLDGSTLFARTNLSRTIAEGEHEVKISRDGYDSWNKTIRMRPGILLRLYYPRLFLLDRRQENVADLGQELAFYAPSRDRANILFAEKLSAIWKWVDVKGDEVRTTELDMTETLPGIEDGQFVGRIEEVKWSANGDHVIVKAVYNDAAEWISVNLRDLKNSLNLTRTFGMNFEQVEMADGSAGKIFVLENQHLRRINTSDQEISRVLLDGITSFANRGGDIAYVTAKKSEADENLSAREIGVYRDGEKAGTTITTIPGDAKAYVTLANYYGESYLGYAVGDQLSILYGLLPTYNENEADLSGLKELYQGEVLAFRPNTLSVSSGDGYFVAQNGKQLAIVSFETTELCQYEAQSAMLKWLDDDMLYTTQDQGIVAWDFDNTNERELVKFVPETIEPKEAIEEVDTKSIGARVTTTTKQPVTSYDVLLANNNKWLYYVTRVDDQAFKLVREKIRD